MLPIAANPPRELHVLTSNDVDQIRDLLRPPRHRHAEALALLRTLALSDTVARDPMGDVEQPTERDLGRLAGRLRDEDDWTQVLPGLARLSLEQVEGTTYSLRIVKHAEATPMRLVRPEDPDADEAVAAMSYNEADRYPFGLKVLGQKAGVNFYEAQALVLLLGLKDREDMFKPIRVGNRGPFLQYSHAALRELRTAVAAGRVPEARAALRAHRAQRAA